MSRKLSWLPTASSTPREPVLVAASGPALVFALNALSFVAVLFVVSRWRREPTRSVLPAERVIGAVRAGLPYARHAPERVRRFHLGDTAPAISHLIAANSRRP